MAKRPHDTKTLPGRMAWLLEKLWRGSQTAMAADLEVTQGTIANVLAGRRKPGRTVLSALTAHPLVNEDWLREGRGAPLVLEATGAAGEAALPLARELFAGMPEDHPECLAEVLYPVPRRLYRASRYWLHIDEPGHPYASDPKSPVQAGDWVLMEPDSSSWPNDLRSRLCIAQIASPEGNQLLCCQDLESPDGTGTTTNFDFLGQLPSGVESTDSHGPHGREQRVIDLGAQKETDSPGREREVVVEVVAVAVYRCGDL